MSTWKEPGTTTKRIKVATVFPSGVGEGYFKVRVSDDSDALEIVVDWPRPLVDIHFLDKKWLHQDTSYTDFHPKFLGFETALCNVRNNVYNTVTSTARVGLPFTVQSRIISSAILTYKESSTHMLYIDLRAIVENYATFKNTSSFEVI